jgi:hypothetical protein
MKHVERMESDNDVCLKPCPSCPDGYVWGSDGPTAKTCPRCLGHAVINFDGSCLRPEQIREVT